jgi:WhiB family redox-sensing transcriptional regulator
MYSKFLQLLMRAPDESDWCNTVARLLEPPSWHAQAACHGVGTELFFPEKGDPLAPAKAVCALCPVAHECLDAAIMDVDGTHGVWGATSRKERQRLRRSRSTAA